MDTRRDFLKTSSLLGFGGTVPAFLGRTATAAPTADRPGAKDTVLVVVQLTGGNDGLNTVVPFANPDYYKLRPNIAIPKDKVQKLTDEVGFAPAVGALGKLYDDKAVCVVQGVGYPNPSQSHFRSMDVWHAGSTAEQLTEGWLGQALKRKSFPGFHLAAGNESAPLALAGAPVRVPSVTSLDDFKLKTASVTGADAAAQKGVITSAANGSAGSGTPSLLDFVARTQMSTYLSSEKLAGVGKNYAPKVPYPASGLATRLKLAAQLIDAGIGARLFYVSIDGFDTHAGQGGSTGAHANLLTQVSEAISAFYRDLAARGHGERLCILTFSEFGRRAYENGSKGTDHGAGAPMLLVGGKVKPGVIGKHPSLQGLKEGNLVHDTDFRQVYAAVLETWLGIESKGIVGDTFKPLDVFAG